MEEDYPYLYLIRIINELFLFTEEIKSYIILYLYQK